MFCTCLRQTTLGIAINLPSHSSQINSHSFMQHHWHLNVMWCRNWAFSLKPVNFYSKIKLVLKRNTSGVKMFGDFESKIFMQAAFSSLLGSHGFIRPEETSAQHASNVLCQIETHFGIHACQVHALQSFFLHTFSDQMLNWGSSAN